MRSLGLAIAVLMSVSLWAESPEVLPLGKVIPKVVCLANPNQSYALYLPTTYRHDVSYPAVFIFEPGARGPIPVGIARQAAEKYGYILIASNNSRNGPLAPQIEAGQAIWNDAHRRFSIDPKRIYFAGFSGGARVATTFAKACNGCAAGVLASGAGFPVGLEPKNASGFLFFSAIGREDFNFPEILLLEPRLKEAKTTYHIRRFDGAHEWAPADVWLEAFSWFNLQAMKSGAHAKNESWIADSYRQALAAASKLVTEKQDYKALRAYRQAAADYDGLLDVAEAHKRATELEKSKAARASEKRERQEAESQASMAAPISVLIQSLIEDPSQRSMTLNELGQRFTEVRNYAKDEKSPKQLVAKRVLTQEFIYAYETGSHLIDARDYRSALILYDVVVQNAKKAPGAHLQKARAYAALGEDKQALAEIQSAIKDGLADRENFDQPEFAALSKSPDFKALIDSLPESKAE